MSTISDVSALGIDLAAFRVQLATTLGIPIEKLEVLVKAKGITVPELRKIQDEVGVPAKPMRQFHGDCRWRMDIEHAGCKVEMTTERIDAARVAGG